MLITRTVNIYHKTDSGKSWKSKPAQTTTETITRKEYENYVSSVSFMNGLFGGTARAYRNYTAAGYIVTRIVLVNPGRTEKHVETYNIMEVEKQ